MNKNKNNEFFIKSSNKRREKKNRIKNKEVILTVGIC